MTRLINAAFILAMSSAASAFTALSQSSSHAFSVRSWGQRGPLHMSRTSSFSEWEQFPDDAPDGGESSEHFGLLEDDASGFVSGDDLHKLRQHVLQLRTDLQHARTADRPRRVLELQRAILRAQQRDAEFVYTVSLERMDAAQARGRFVEAEQFRADASKARKALPQFNLDGLWVGKYGDSGYQMINVTYVGDTLRAYKVTGDQNVPKGELSFTVDLSPKSTGRLLEPIELNKSASRQWGAKFLSRFEGKGQVAAEGFTNSQFIEGQLILVNEFFSFAWLPIGHQVFFGRPNPELVLKLLKDSEEGGSSVDKARAHLERCLEETEHYLEDDVSEEADVPFQQDCYGIQGFFD